MIEQVIRAVCPHLGNRQIQQAIEILRGTPLVQHGRLPQANYRLGPVKKGTSNHDALLLLGTKMIERCKMYEFDALAASQLGIPYPMVVFRDPEVIIQLPRYVPHHNCGRTFRLEGCGSFCQGRYNTYIVTYPACGDLTFYNETGEQERYCRVETGIWFNSQDVEISAGRSLNIGSYIHEFRHLQGLTAAHNGWLLHPRDLPDWAWGEIETAFLNNVNPEWRKAIQKLMLNFSATEDPVLRGKQTLCRYFQVKAGLNNPPQTILPSSWYHPRPYKVTTAFGYAQVIQKLF